MMRALQKRSESQPTNGENRMKGSTMMAPQRVFQVPLCAVQPDAQGNQQELGPFFIKGVLRLNQHEPPKAPHGTLRACPGVWALEFMKLQAGLLRFFQAGAAEQAQHADDGGQQGAGNQGGFFTETAHFRAGEQILEYYQAQEGGGGSPPASSSGFAAQVNGNGPERGGTSSWLASNT